MHTETHGVVWAVVSASSQASGCHLQAVRDCHPATAVVDASEGASSQRVGVGAEGDGGSCKDVGGSCMAAGRRTRSEASEEADRRPYTVRKWAGLPLRGMLVHVPNTARQPGPLRRTAKSEAGTLGRRISSRITKCGRTGNLVSVFSRQRDGLPIFPSKPTQARATRAAWALSLGSAW